MSLNETEGLDIIDLVSKCMKEKKLVSFATARKVALKTEAIANRFGEKFRQTDCQLLVTAFTTVEEGADALLVNAQGCYAPKVAERHQAWLAKNGYKVTIEAKAPKGVAALG